jgi:hypothetical protein
VLSGYQSVLSHVKGLSQASLNFVQEVPELSKNNRLLLTFREVNHQNEVFPMSIPPYHIFLKNKTLRTG